MEAELIALASASEETNWLRDLLYEIPPWVKPIPPILIHCDSTATIGRVKNRYYNGKFRPIRRKHSTVWSYLSSGIITMDYIKSNDNLADPFTKALAKDRVWNTSRGMGLKSIGLWAMYEDTQNQEPKILRIGCNGKNKPYDGRKKYTIYFFNYSFL